jgi:hypothetical protein
MGYPIFPSHPRMGNIISIPRWDIPYIPSQGGIIYIPSQDGISHTPHPRMGLSQEKLSTKKTYVMEHFRRSL